MLIKNFLGQKVMQIYISSEKNLCQVNGNQLIKSALIVY